MLGRGQDCVREMHLQASHKCTLNSNQRNCALRSVTGGNDLKEHFTPKNDHSYINYSPHVWLNLRGKLCFFDMPPP